jgi:hypothetical protein
MSILARILGRKNRKSEAHPIPSDKTPQKGKEGNGNGKQSVHKIILFWLDNIPNEKNAQAIADQLTREMHPELYFATTTAINECLSMRSILEVMNEIIMPVTARVAIDHRGSADKKTLVEMAKQRSMHIAVMQLIEEKLQEAHGFEHSDHPNKLICKFLETTAVPCYYALILDSDIDPSNYEFATGIGGCKLSTLFTEAANTVPS